MDDQEFVIIGGGLAAASAAEEFRKKGFAGKVTIVAAEEHVPYIRPPLSKGYLAGSEELDAAFVHPADWYREHDIDVMQGRSAQKLDLAEKRVLLDDGSLLQYDKLLLATGASPRRLPIDGGNLDGVHYLRTIEDSQSLHEELKDGGRRLVLIGSGWIGMEVGASARTLGNEVTDPGARPHPVGERDRRRTGDHVRRPASGAWSCAAAERRGEAASSATAACPGSSLRTARWCQPTWC